MFKDSLSCVAVSGPTNDQQPAFQWSTSGWPRPQGHPDKWDFEVQKIQLDFWNASWSNMFNSVLEEIFFEVFSEANCMVNWRFVAQ